MSQPPIDAGHELKRGLWWMGSATVAMRVLDVAGSLLVLQFLSKSEVGLAALAWSFSVALESFNGLGVGYVIVRQRELSHADLSGLFWFCTLLGVAAMAIMAAVGPFLAIFYADYRLYPMMVVAALKLVFVGAALVPLSVLTRDLQYRVTGTVQTLATLSEALTKVILVAAGLGAWGLVLANLARGVFLWLALQWLAPFRPLFRAADAAVRRAIGFGFRVASSGIIYSVYRNLDNLLIGRVLGTSVLGIYQTAFQLGMTPLEIVGQLVNRVQFPIYSALREKPAELVLAFNRSVRTMLLFLGPVAVLVALGSPDILALIGHGRWLPAVPLIQVLAGASLLRGVSQLFPQFYVATGHPHYAVVDSALTGVTLAIGFGAVLLVAPAAVAAQWVAWVWVLSYPVPLFAHSIMVRRCAPVSMVGLVRTLARPGLGIVILLLLGMLGTLSRIWLPHVLSLTLVAGLILAGHVLFLRYGLRLRGRDLLPRRTAPE